MKLIKGHDFLQSWNIVLGIDASSTPSAEVQSMIFQEPYKVNCQQLHLLPYYIEKVKSNILCEGHQLTQRRKSVL